MEKLVANAHCRFILEEKQTTEKQTRETQQQKIGVKLRMNGIE